MLLERARFVKILPIFCAVCHLTVTFPTRNRHAYDDARQLQVNISLSGAIFGSLGSSISIPCLASLSSKLSPGSSPPVVPRIKWTVVSGGVEKEILVARGERLRVKKAYQDRAAMLNYTSSPDDLSLWLGDLRHSDSGHYRCEVQQGLEDASDLIEVKVRGVVFHYRDAFDRYDLTFQQAKEACKAMDAQIATPDQLLAAFNDGFEQCDAGWLSDQSVRYPIHTPREPCYGDMIEKPGVRNYGTMDPEKLFDVYCYAEQMNGEVFHDTVPQRLSFDEAQDYCISLGAKLATPGQLYTAWSEGLDYCSPGWLSDGSVRYPIITPRQHCGGFQPGVKTVYRFTNQTGFPEPSSLYDVYCFKGTSDEFQVSEVTTEAGDTEQNVVILMETDQELKLNQQAEQVEREAQSVLISLPFISSIYTGKTSDTTDPTVISDITDSPSSTSAVDLLHRLEKTSTISSFQQPVVVTHAISSTDSYNPQNNSSYLPAVYNETDQNQNQSLSFQSEFERTTYSPHTQNIVQEVNLEETTPGTEKLKHPQDLHEFNLTVDRAVTNDSEVSSDHTQEEGFWEATTLTVNPMLQGRYEDAEVEDPVQMMTTTHTSQEEGLLPTQAAQTNESATETLTSLWTNMDGSAENSEEKDTEVEGVTFLPSSLSSTGSFTTHPPPSALPTSAPTEPDSAASDHIFLSGSMDRMGLHIFSTVPQLWESSISRQEGSSSLETEDIPSMESQDKQLQATTSVDQQVSEVSLAITESPEGLNTSDTPTKVTIAHHQTSGYRVYLDTVTGSYEEASGFEPVTVSSTLKESIKNQPSAPTTEREFPVSPDNERDSKVLVSLLLYETTEVATVNDLDEGANASTTFEDKIKVAPTVAHVKETKVFPSILHKEQTTTAVTSEGEAKVPSAFDYKEEANGVTPFVLEGENKVVSTIDYGEEATGATSFVLEGEDKVTPTIDYEEEVNSVTTIVVEGEDKVAPTLEDFSISPLNSQTSKWALLTTTTEPQLSVSDVEFRQKFSSTTASESSVTTKPITGTTKTTSAPITTTHGSRHNLSPATTTKEVFLETAEPQKETHLIPPVDHGLIDVEISLTKLPTLLILPNEGAAVGDAGNSSDACDEDQCLNGGTCFESNKQVKCLCLPTYGGDFCENDLEQCEPGWDKFQGFCYRHFGQRLTWAAAEQHCRMMGAHLASIMSPEEQAFINDNYKEYQWTGLNDKALEDDFVWSDGNPLMYENWYKGQPDSYFQSGEDCVVMVWHDDGRWSDVPCNYHLSYTCKKGTASCGPPPKVRNASPFGKVRQRYGINAIVRYRCAEGFRQKLKPLIRCLSGGRWERPEVLCVHGSKGKALSVTESNFAAAENEFESTTEAPQYWDIKF
ncbi:brevican core protein-like [Menidia menidia]